MSPPSKDPRETFASAYIPEPNTGCWLWSMSLMSNGYGQLSGGGARYAAHRFSYQLHHGPIPDGMMVLHSCDNCACVNPAHLRAGTAQDNADDLTRRGRRTRHSADDAARRVSRPRGSRVYCAVIDEAVATRIAAAHRPGANVSQLARDFGVSRSVVRGILEGRTWRHVVGL